jgi:hypothetical protein
MTPDDFPDPKDGFVLTHFLVVSDQDRSRDFYQSIFDGRVLLERDPVIMKVANSWLILNLGGGPTDDKPTVTLVTFEASTASGSMISGGLSSDGNPGMHTMSRSLTITEGYRCCRVEGPHRTRVRS